MTSRWKAAACVSVFVLGLNGGARAAAPVSYRLASRRGRVVIESSKGEVIPWACYSLGIDLSVDEWKKKHPDLIKAGVHLFQITLIPTKGKYWDSPFFSLDGKPMREPRMPIRLTTKATWLIQQDPRTRLIVRFGINTDPTWRKEHLDHFAPLSNPPRGYQDAYSLRPSLASQVCLERTDRLLRDVVAWCERQPWRDRVVGYAVFPYGEGATEAALFGEMFDTSPVMQKAFRAFLRKKYKTDAALRQAWGDKTVGLDTVKVPTKVDWLAKRDRLKILHWPDPKKVARERDYFLLQKDLFHQFWGRVFATMQDATSARPVIKGYDTLKQHLQGWLHNPCFLADWHPGSLDTYGSILLGSGSLGAAPLLDHPGLDVLMTPGMYYNRAVGYAWESEGLSDTLALRNKANFMEADMRTWVRTTWRGKPFKKGQLILDAGTFMTPAEMRAGFDRTLGWALSRNQMYYYASVCGANWWFHAPPILEKIAQQQRIIAASADMPWQNTTDAVCIVVDDESPLYEDFSSGYQSLAVYRQIEEGLGLCGVPYRIHLLSDLAKDNFPDYKCYLFPNLFKVDAGVEALLRQKVLRNGHVAIFGPGTGITDGHTRSAAGATRLLGVPMELVTKSCARRVMLQNHGHPLSKRLGALTYGESYAFGPILVPTQQRFGANATARLLGATFYYYFFDRPGIFVNDFGRGGCGSGKPGARARGDYAVVFSAAVPLPPELLRECARYAGCHVWCEQNAVVHASASFVALHTVRTGRHVIRVPRKADVVDLNANRTIARQTDRIVLDIQAPATRLFRLGAASAGAAPR